MATYILKRKTYSDEKQGMSTGKKIALGTAGTLATAGAAFAGAKGGVFGAKAMKSANKMWGNAGATLSRNGMKGIGDKMMMSGAEGMGKAQGKIRADQLTKKGLDEASVLAGQQRAEKAVAENQLNKFLKKSEVQKA